MSGWKSRKFEECIERVKYPNKIPKKSFLHEGTFPIVSQEAGFINGYWSNDKDVFRIEKPVVVFGDHTTVLKYVDFDFVIGADGVKVLQPIDAIDPRYFYYYLKSCALEQLGYARHYRVLKELTVHFPTSIPEQKHIVAILDEAFAGLDQTIVNTEKNITNARDLFEGHLDQVFTERGEGWVDKTLGDACNFSQGVQVDVKSQSETKNDEFQIRFLRIIDFTQGSEQPRYIEYPGAKFVVTDDDVSLVRYGASTGFVCSGLNGAIANNLFQVIPKDESLSRKFLFNYLRSPIFQGCIKKAISGTAMPAISFALIRDIEISAPRLLEQEQINKKIQILSAHAQSFEKAQQQKLLAVTELKQSILHKALTGELTSRAAEEAPA